MKFKKITIENFKSIGTEPITVNLDFKDTVLLTGKNGAGKTTLSDAIVWCIYGVTKLKADNVVNKFIGKNTKVELEFSEGGKNYIITRYRKHDTHKNNIYLFEDGKNITLKNASDTQALIQEIIGIDIKAFLSSIVLSSETYKQFLRETNSVRLQIFESVFSLKELNALNKLNKQRISSVQKDIKERKSQVESIESFITSDAEALRRYKENYEQVVKRHDEEAEKLKFEISDIELEIAEKSTIDIEDELNNATRYESDMRNYQVMKSNLKTMKANLSAMTVNRDNLIEKRKEYEETTSKYSYELFKDEISKISIKEKQDAEIKAIEETNLKLNSEKTKLSSERAGLDGNVTVANAAIEFANKQLDSIANHVCPVCGNTIDDSHTKSIKEENLKVLKEKGSEIEKLRSRISEIDDRINSIEVEISENNDKIDSYEPIEIKYTAAEIRILLPKLKIATAELPNLITEISSKESDILSLSTTIIDNESKLNSMATVNSKYSVAELNSMKNEISSLKSKLEVKKALLDSNIKSRGKLFDSAYVTKIANNIKSRKANKASIEEELKEFNKKNSVYAALDGVFSNGDNGFKKYFINRVISLFNDKVNTFLPFFFEDEITITFDKDLNNAIIYKGKETDFDELSSGEKTRCELCVVFSLYFMVKTLFGTGENSLMVIDEIIDRGLDDVGVIASKQILDDIAKDTAIFVVTHRDDLKELFNRSITVYKDGDGFTKLK